MPTAPRVTEHLFRFIDNWSENARRNSMASSRDAAAPFAIANVEAIVRSLRSCYALIDKLKAEGCPWRIDDKGRHVCVYCDAPERPGKGGEPEYDHKASCLYLEILRA